LLQMVPYLSVVVAIKNCFDLAKVFGKDVAYGIGLLFLPIIFLPILAFGDAKYQGTTKLI